MPDDSSTKAGIWMLQMPQDRSPLSEGEWSRMVTHHFHIDRVIVLAEEDFDFQVQHLGILMHYNADVSQYNILQLALCTEERD